jgi:glucosamine--fructose-6-phosphate aminotransferase (isomerizing)
MCGIVGAIAQREVAPILLEGLRRLEYRGYDSAGVAVMNSRAELERLRTTGKVAELVNAYDRSPVQGLSGIAHTRWATHGKPTESNAHPHICRNKVAVVHNGIIENHEALREQQKKQGFTFTSDTDTEVVVHQVYYHLDQGDNLLEAVKHTCRDMEGAYALGIISISEPDRLIAARRGSPLVIGVGIGEYYIASDVAALLPVTQRFIFLEDGDIADLTSHGMVIYNSDGEQVERAECRSELSADAVERGEYRHYMLKEIYEQPRAIADTLEGRIYPRLPGPCTGGRIRRGCRADFCKGPGCAYHRLWHQLSRGHDWTLLDGIAGRHSVQC